MEDTSNTTVQELLSREANTPRIVADVSDLVDKIKQICVAQKDIMETGDLYITIRYFAGQEKLWRVFLLSATTWLYADDNQEWRLFFEQILKLVSYMRAFHVKPRYPTKYCLLGEISNNCNKLEEFDKLIKYKWEEILQVPKYESFNLLKRHQVLGIFLNFIRAILKEVVQEEPDLYFEEHMLKWTFTITSSMMEKLAALAEDISFVTFFLGDIPLQYPDFEWEKQIKLWDEIENMATQAGSLLFKLFVGRIQGLDVIHVLLDIKHKTSQVKVEIKEYVEAFQATNTKSKAFKKPDDGLLVMGSVYWLLEHLRVLLDNNADFILALKCEIEMLYKELFSLSSTVMNIGMNSQRKDHLLAEFSHIVCTAEYLITCCDIQSTPDWYLKGRIAYLIQEIKLVEEAIDTKENLEGDTMPRAKPPSYPNPKFMVELPEEIAIVEELTSADFCRKFICIAGMPGLGKTTLAEKVYNNSAISSIFSLRARCCVTQTYTVKGLLLELLNSIDKITPDMQEKDAAELGHMLHKKLCGSRYLIFMDDLWGIDPWCEIALYIKNENNGSRVIFTSRKADLVSPGVEHMVYKPNLLSKKDSWLLLKRTVFGESKIPQEFKLLGKEIAGKCEGLPLAILLIAGVLQRIEKRASIWEQVAALLNKHVAAEQNIMENILVESYDNLPHYLQPCFLYCCIFPEGKVFKARKLKRLRIAEGFVGKTVSNVGAKECLKELVDRNLIMIIDHRPNGDIKTCRMHALLHEFCSAKAKQGNFTKAIKSSSIDIYEPYHRIALVDAKSEHLENFQPFSPHLRSLLVISTGRFPAKVNSFSYLSDGLKLIRVLDFESIWVRDFPSAIGQLVSLRYLAIEGRFYSLPPSMLNLENLETLRLSGEFKCMPEVIFCLPKLRHLRLWNHDGSGSGVIIMPKGKEMLRDDKSLSVHEVETLNGVRVTSPQDEDVLRRFQSLRYLKCSVGSTMDGTTSRFPKLDFLQQLETLNISLHALCFKRFVPKITSAEFPSSLKSLTLSSLLLPWKKMSAIAKLLPNLEVLKILTDAFKGEEWDMEIDEVEFPRLKYLKFQSLNIRRWNVADSDRFNVLEKLVLENCHYLEEIPEAFGYIYTLKMIEIKKCTSSMVNSAMEWREQLSGQLEVKVHLVHPGLAHKCRLPRRKVKTNH